MFLMSEDLIRDRKILVNEARGLSSFLLQYAIESEQNGNSDNIVLTFDKDGIIQLSSMLMQLAEQINNEKQN